MVGRKAERPSAIVRRPSASEAFRAAARLAAGARAELSAARVALVRLERMKLSST